MRWIVTALMMAFFRRFGGAAGVDRLRADEFARVKRETRLTAWWFLPAAVVVSVGVWSAVAFGLISLRRSLDSPCTNPFLDDRYADIIGGFSFVALLGFGHSVCTLHALLFGRAAGLEPRLWRRWYVTRWEALPHRASLLLLAVMLPLSVPFVLIAWNHGARVCDEGISYSPSLVSRFEFTYAEVAAITLYDARVVMGSPRQRPNLVVEFTNGDRWAYAREPSPGGVTVAAVAEYVGRKSGRAVGRAAMKP